MHWSTRHHYTFRSVWDLSAPPAAVYGVLERAGEYPTWWPQVRSVTPLDDISGVAVFRSFLPYELTVTATEKRRDPAGGVLEIAMSGDLDGWARWTLSARAGGTRAVYEQQVEVRRPLMRRFALPGRPVFLANHAWMMRGGRRGLEALLQRV
ncbi:polyketide cyclase [Streptomyces sp. SID14478]|uniref:SRPBCC family protein n=1 Tax=Streptomyces sp. SID14478 TaxID=2706073 RepID=UPI0013DBB674|nr:SRPBCC family protein [Streptomyces sp. SID14478]NEB78734.1 polyketide cyclase [Streptomyces sp. SID14478]